MITLDDYAPIVGEEVVGQLHRLAEHLQGRRFVHINSTAVGGGGGGDSVLGRAADEPVGS